jgi:NAD(P)H dehydrogenase (quinone)
MTIAVTGAGGQLGRLVVEDLLARGIPAAEIVAGTRRPEALADLAARGVQVRHADYDDVASLDAALAGAEKVLVVSGTDFGRRPAQHAAAAAAAQRAGARLVVYTSAPQADTTTMLLAAEHRASEEAIRALGVPFTFLRNYWYFENYTAQLPTFLEHGAIVGAAGDGRISGAARADFAAAAAAVLATEGHENAVYELGGEPSFTLGQLADVVSKAADSQVVYRDVPTEELQKVLVGAGLPEQLAAVMADVDKHIAQGALYTDTGDLKRLIGRPTTSLEDVVASAVAAR